YTIIYCDIVLYTFFFFFQAEDGIRDPLVTGVQTCALPIYFMGLFSWLGRLFGARPQSPEQRLTQVIKDLRARESGRTAQTPARQIGRASCRERGESEVGAVG